MALLGTVSVVLSCLIYDKLIKKENRIHNEKAEREKVNTNLNLPYKRFLRVESRDPPISNKGTLYILGQ